MYRATRIRLYPTREQCQQLAGEFGAARWVYNHFLHLKTTAWKENKKSIGYFETSAQLTALKRQNETTWLQEATADALKQSLRHLDTAYQRLFKRMARYPRFKSRYGKQSVSHTQGISVQDRAVKIPKIGLIKAVLHRDIVGKIKTCTLTKTCSGKYFISILTDDGLEAPEPVRSLKDNQILGIDMGITDLSIDSNGHKVANPRFMKRAKANLKRKQQSLSRKKKGSANRNKARLLVAKVHEKVANTRNDFQHKLSRRLVDENQAIIVETLKVKNMVKNKRLAKHISDAAWGNLIHKLEYKALWYGKHLIKIDQWFPSSKTCSDCGMKVKALSLDVRKWTCENCGIEHDRDINAAINIKQQGILKLMAEGIPVTARGGRINLAMCQ